jgi:hypothetical protein
MIWKRNSESEWDVDEAAAAEVGFWDMTGVASVKDIRYVYGERMICKQLRLRP